MGRVTRALYVGMQQNLNFKAFSGFGQDELFIGLCEKISGFFPVDGDRRECVEMHADDRVGAEELGGVDRVDHIHGEMIAHA